MVYYNLQIYKVIKISQMFIIAYRVCLQYVLPSERKLLMIYCLLRMVFLIFLTENVHVKNNYDSCVCMCIYYRLVYAVWYNIIFNVLV